MLLATVLCLLASSMTIVSGADWCYQSQVTCSSTCTGPEAWVDISEQCNSSTLQSPINIITNRREFDKNLTKFEFTGHQQIFNGPLMNNGHYVQLNLPSTITIKGGHLPTSYKALQLHMHWGKDGGPGSEHTIDGEQFPMEMHIVHIKEEYDSLSQAEKDHEGVAVLAFFFQESKSDNKKFDPLINALKNITGANDNITLSGVSLTMFMLPEKNMTKYYRYHGSLTTPSCAEAVVFSLFEETISLSRKQLTAFSQLQFSDGKPMVNTYRPLQPRNGRVVYYSGGNVALVSTVLLMLSVLISCMLSLHATR